jgi:hypothetical protein
LGTTLSLLTIFENHPANDITSPTDHAGGAITLRFSGDALTTAGGQDQTGFSLKLDLDPFLISPLILDGQEDFSQAFTPSPNIFLERWAVPQYFQNVPCFHVRGLDSDLQNRLWAF